MESSGGIKASLQGRYASALFDLASEQGAVSVVEGDLERLGQALRDSADFAALIRNPQITRAAAGRAVDSVAELLDVGSPTASFLGVLSANRRLATLPEIIRAFQTIAAAARGEVAAEVASARALSEEQLEALRQKLQAREGRAIKLTARVDPELLGGLVVTVGSKRIDGSIRTRLNTLAQAMKG